MKIGDDDETFGLSFFADDDVGESMTPWRIYGASGLDEVSLV